MPLSEDQRLSALHDCAVLDTPPEDAFDDLASLARILCETPIALVSLVDRDRQWFKAALGLETRETPRAIAFCAHAIQQPEPLIVPDARQDPRFADNPLVTGPPEFRFYAGFPLIDDAGAALGTLCVLDVRPRELDAQRLDALRILAKQVVAQLALRRLLAEVERAHRRSSFVFEASKLLSVSLDIDATLQALASLTVPAFADVCSIVVCAPDGSLRRVGEAAIDEPTEQELRRMREVSADDAQIAMRAAMDARRPLLVRDYQGWVAGQLPREHPYRQRIERMGVTSGLLAPMMIGGSVRGLLTMGDLDRTGRSYDEEDLVLVAQLAQRAALALENARLFGEARRADQAKDTLLAAVSHDLRTPLNAIQGWVHLMRDRPSDAQLRARALDVIERNVRVQTRLVEDLVDASRIAAGKLHVCRDSVELGVAVAEALDAVHHLTEPKKMTLRVTLDPHVGKVLGDADRLAQVVWNLVSNAAKFSSPEKEVEITLRRDGDMAELVVRDHGCGIDPSFLPHVFDPFRQDEGGVGRKLGGLGIGLAITQHIVRAHEGTIEAHSDGPGTGAAFVVRLPLVRVAPGSASSLGRTSR